MYIIEEDLWHKETIGAGSGDIFTEGYRDAPAFGDWGG